MFIGRQRELRRLNELHQSGRFECAIIYGRRRVGKTTLINEFIHGKDAIFFAALETSAEDNLESFSRSILRYRLGDTPMASFASYQDALDTICELAQEKRVILVIDEYPYLAASYRGFSSMLQAMIDHRLKSSTLMLILCGSSMSFMENQVLGYQSPLYGRRTAQLKIEPFSYFDSRDYHPMLPAIDAAAVYGITGGVPSYLEQIDASRSVEENIIRCFFTPSAYLYEEPTNLLKQEVREPAYYNAIIHAIATGSSRLSEISTRAGVETSACSAYLKNLISLGIVKKETPFREDTSKKTIYRIEDSMFRFWYRFVPDNASMIHNGLTDLVWRRVAPQIPAFMGGVFEEICKQWLWRENAAGRLPFPFSDLGRWWGNDPIRKRETEIDIMAHVDENTAIFCACKWTNEKVDAGTLEALAERSRLFRYHRVYLMLFSKSGFTEHCENQAQAFGNVGLVRFADMSLGAHES